MPQQKTALKYLNEEPKRPRGRKRITWKKWCENLNDYNLNCDSAAERAKDSEHWKHWKKGYKKMSFLSKNLPDTV